MSLSTIRAAATAVLLAVVMGSIALAGTTGKVRGKVTDKQTGEPLVGATVIIEGTSQGAATSIDGEYIILNVQPGTYVLRARFLGYKDVTVSNVQVNVDLTTEINFAMPSEAVQLGGVQIVAETPLVNKSATNSVSLYNAQTIANMPVRGVNAVFALSGGVVSQDGNFYVRGGRSDEVAYYVDGVPVTNPMNMSSSLNVITNSIQEVSAQIGGMTAEYGGALSGVVNTTTKIGSPKYQFSFEGITDGFLSGTKKYLGTYSYGLNEYVATLGGPVVPGDDRIRFFVAGQRVFNRSNPTFLDGVKFPLTFDSTQMTGVNYAVANRDSGILVPGVTTGTATRYTNLLNSVNLQGGRNFGGVSDDQYSVNGNVYFDLTKVNIKVGGSYTTSTSYDAVGKSFDVLQILSGTWRPIRYDNQNASAYLKFTHILDPSTYYSVNFNYFRWYQEQGDAVLFSNYYEYGDPNNPANRYLIGPSEEPPVVQYDGFDINPLGHMGVTGDGYRKQLRTSSGGRVDFVHQFGTSWELKLGGEATYYTIRSYLVPGIGLYGAKFRSPNSSDWVVYNNANVSSYGYDIYGNTFDGGVFKDRQGTVVNLPDEGPRHPLFGGAYIQNKIELPDLIVNAGLRFDYIDPGTKGYKDAQNIGLTDIDGVPIVADSSLVAQSATMQVSPRIGFSFPVTDRTVFHAEYGKFIEEGSLSDLYDTRTVAARFLQGGFARQYPNPNLKPERTTDYQLGFRQQLGDVAAFDATFFYKDTKDLHVIRYVYPDPGATIPSYFTNVNGDFGTIKGLTFTFNVRRFERLALDANYTIQSALATGSTSGDHFDIAWQDNSGINGRPYFPVIPSPTEFDRSHTGSINADYRFAEEDGPTIFGTKLLERTGLNLLLTFSSGRRYTVQDVVGAFSFSTSNAPTPHEDLNTSTGPWSYQIDLKLDRTVRVFGTTDLNVYLWVVNLLNRQNIVNLYPATGVPTTDGWLATEAGRNWAARNGGSAASLYQYMVNNLGFYGTPRIIRLGAKITM